MTLIYDNKEDISTEFIPIWFNKKTMKIDIENKYYTENELKIPITNYIKFYRNRHWTPTIDFHIYSNLEEIQYLFPGCIPIKETDIQLIDGKWSYYVSFNRTTYLYNTITEKMRFYKDNSYCIIM